MTHKKWDVVGNEHRAEAVALVGIGVSVWDSVYRITRFPEPGQVVRAVERSDGVGGGVTIAIATAARLGTDTAMVDSLGDDLASKAILGSLRNEDVVTDAIEQTDGATASTASIWSDEATRERTIVFHPGSASDRLQWNEHIEDAIAGAKMLHVNGRHGRVCRRAIGFAKSNGVRISFDGGAHRYRDEILAMLVSSEIAIVARQFAESHFESKRRLSATGLNNQKLVEFLLDDLDCDIAGVTDGERGSFLSERGKACIHQPAIEPQRAIDTTGCGDTYHGAFLHALLEGGHVQEAAKLAAEVASRNARSIGALSQWGAEK